MTMPLPVWINLQQTMLHNASNAPCNISCGKAAIIILGATVVIYLIFDIFINKWGK